MTSPTRERILDALEAVIAAHGTAGTTLEAVAAEAGVSKGGLLYHFGTKEALFTGLLERLRRLAEEDVAQWTSSPDGLVRAYLDSSTDAEGSYTNTLIAALRLVGTPNIDVEGAIVDSFETWYSTLSADIDDPVTARLVHLVGDGLYLHSLVGSQAHPLDAQVVERVVGFVDAARRSGSAGSAS